MAQPNANTRAHLEWLGFVQPVGLVVSAPALDKAGVVLRRSDKEGQRRLQEAVLHQRGSGDGESQPFLPDFEAFARTVLDWKFSPRGFAGGDGAPLPDELGLHLPDHGETLRPDFAVREREPQGGGSPWQLLVQTIDCGLDFDQVVPGANRLEASPHSRMERLLRAKRVPAGLLFNGHALRLVSAPHGESSGWMDFRVADMLLVAGRPICTALRELLNERRLLALPGNQRLGALLADSRKYQNEVSEKLANQVLHALYELLRGFQAAHDASRGELLDEQLRADRNDIYRGLLAVILRLVFLLYAEERGLLLSNPSNRTFERHYSLGGLHERLRADAALHPDTMDQRYGAWAGLLTLFRMIHHGADAAGLRLPPRHGVLFDPDRYAFLEGRPIGVSQNHLRVEAPRVSDGAIFRALQKLLVLDGERLSYRALDVEQIGSVYETMMGFELARAEGRSAAIRTAKKHGAPATVNLEELLAEPAGKRLRWLKQRTDRKLTGKNAKAVRGAGTLEELHAALDPVIDRNATPDLARRGDLILQPSEERRRSGAHYTPRSLTGPIVRDTLEPILARLCREAAAPVPRPEQILDLAVCDPAMGSGAFLVEACRQLADVLVESWHYHDAAPELSPDDDATDETIQARRLVARNCLYGVDRNPVAVDLAKLSLWLATLARDQPLTFLDHAFRHGDSLVGLDLEQIRAFHWKGGRKRFQAGIETTWIGDQVEKALRLRREIQDAAAETPDWELRDRLDEADSALARVKTRGDLALAAFFKGRKPRERERLRREFAQALQSPPADKAAAGDPGVSVRQSRRKRQASRRVGRRRATASAELHSARAPAALGSSVTVRPPKIGSYATWLEHLRNANPPLAPFHWEIEFPEVFLPEERENPGFDAIVGNPPFAGKNTIAKANAAGYKDWLKQLHERSHGNADLVAHFFRRSFGLLRERGTLGLIATNTIAQGDTRSTGLRWICQHCGEIFNARRRVPWPRLAAVIVSVVHLHRGAWHGPRTLDGVAQPKITAFLFHRGGHDDPARLAENVGKSFQGSIVLGMGFTFDDTDTKGVATPLAEMRRLIAENPRNRGAIFPYIGGKEVNTSPTHAHHRFVINFRDWPLRRADLGATWQAADAGRRRDWQRDGIVPLEYPGPVAEDWPELLGIVKEQVKPARDLQNRKALRERWWHYAEKRPGLHAAIAGLDRVLVVNCGATTHAAFAFLPSRTVFAHSLAVFPLDTHAAFCALQARPHEIWARFFGSSLEDRLRYTPSDCFETFPFPKGWEAHPALEAAGETYYAFRAALMIENNEGLTKTCNRFHDPSERDPRIAELRRLHAAMDRAVLDAYGWNDIPADCEFLPDHEIDEVSGAQGGNPYRYRWPNEPREEVLARLLELNARRAAAEKRGTTGR